MRGSSQKGSSFINMAGLTLLVAVVGFLVALVCLRSWHDTKVVEMTTYVRGFFQKYYDGSSELMKENTRLYSPIALKNYGLLEQCDEDLSFFGNGRVVCKQPLGEFDFSAEYQKPALNTEAYIHFNDIYKTRSCEQFLNVGWQDVLPAYLWGKNGYITVASENTKGQMYFSNNPEAIAKEGAQQRPTPEFTKFVCDLCKASNFCTIKFFLEFTNSAEQVTFPAEFVGENKEQPEGEGEVKKEGDTYIKTNGDYQEVVTYQDGGIFSGATFSGGALSSVYEGTYTAQGITSYQSYTDANKTNRLRKIDNITYGKDGKVNSYEQDSKKFLLMDSSKNCLVVDQENNSKKLGNCAQPFQEKVSFVGLNYDENGLLNEISDEENGGKLFTFEYDQKTGKLLGYCDVPNGKCHVVNDGRDIKDIIHQDVPETIGKFNNLYKQQEASSSKKTGKQKYRALTKDEALKYVRDKDNKVKVTFK